MLPPSRTPLAQCFLETGCSAATKGAGAKGTPGWPRCLWSGSGCEGEQQQPGSPTASSLPRPLRRSRKPRSPLQAGLDPGRRPCGHCPLSSYAPRRLYGDCSGFAKKLQAPHWIPCKLLKQHCRRWSYSRFSTGIPDREIHSWSRSICPAVRFRAPTREGTQENHAFLDLQGWLQGGKLPLSLRTLLSLSWSCGTWHHSLPGKSNSTICSARISWLGFGLDFRRIIWKKELSSKAPCDTLITQCLQHLLMFAKNKIKTNRPWYSPSIGHYMPLPLIEYWFQALVHVFLTAPSQNILKMISKCICIEFGVWHKTHVILFTFVIHRCTPKNIPKNACTPRSVEGVQGAPRSLVPGKKRVSLRWLLLFHFLLQHLESLQPLAEEIFLLKPNPLVSRTAPNRSDTVALIKNTLKYVR